MAVRTDPDLDHLLFDEDADPGLPSSPIATPESGIPPLVPSVFSEPWSVEFGAASPASVTLPAPMRIQLDMVSRALVAAATPDEDDAPVPVSPVASAAPSTGPLMAVSQPVDQVPAIGADAANETASQSAFDDAPGVTLTKPITDVGFTSQKIVANESRTGVTTVDIGADGNLYSGDIFGNIVKYTLDPATGLATSAETIINVGGPITGLKFDPDSPAGDMDLWISYATTEGRYSSVVSEISITANSAIEQRKITGLPYGDHQVNGLDFGPDGKLYIQAGGLASLGEFAPGAFADPEVPLSAALLVADVNNDPRFSGGPINVQANENGQGYDPFAPNAPVQIYATGLRNAYDIEWTRNAAGEVVAVAGVNGNSLDQAETPDDPSTARNENFFGIKPPEQFVVIEEGNYYGHPNPSRGEYILNGGNPTGGNDPWEIGRYAVGTQPEAGFDPDLIFNIDRFGADSPNGIDTYIDGTILQTTFSGDRKILLMSVDANNRPVYLGDLQNPNGGDITFSSPLDIVTDPATGRIYVANFGQRQSDPSNGAVFLLTPEAGAIQETGTGPVPVVPPAPNPQPDPDPDPAPVPTPPPADLGTGQRIEAEVFQNPSGVAPEAYGVASGGTVLSLTGGVTSGSSQARFSGESGAYDLTIGYFDSQQGDGTIAVFVNEIAVGSIPLDRTGISGNTPLEAVFEGVALNPGNTIRFEVSTDGAEPGRLDYIELAPASAAPVPTPTPDPAPNPVPTPPTMDDVRTSVWSEGFEGLSAGARSDTGDTAWTTSTTATATPPVYGVDGGGFAFSNATQGDNEDNAFHTFTTEAVDISGLSDVRISFSLFSTEGLETGGGARDFIRVFAVVDGERTQIFSRDGGPANATQTLMLDGIPEGESLVIVFEAKTTFETEVYRIDNLDVSGVVGTGSEAPLPPPAQSPDPLPPAHPLPMSDPVGPTDGPMPDLADQVHHGVADMDRVEAGAGSDMLDPSPAFVFEAFVEGLAFSIDARVDASLGLLGEYDPLNALFSIDPADFTEIA